MNKQNDSDWFKLTCDKTGTKWLRVVRGKLVDGAEFAGFTINGCDTSLKSSLRFSFRSVYSNYIASRNLSDDSAGDQTARTGRKDSQDVPWREDLLRHPL